MPWWIAWLIAAISTAAFVRLWFWEVRRILNDRKSVVDSAAGQFMAFRRRVEAAPGDEALTAIMQRSKSIYRQAADNYNRARTRPWAYLPALLMGFRRASADSDSPWQDAPGGQ